MKAARSETGSPKSDVLYSPVPPSDRYKVMLTGAPYTFITNVNITGNKVKCLTSSQSMIDHP